MPEIKHQFTGGKMNKDLDERLVPNGQYRDALNIQVSTSEDSDVGAVQNILGNSLVLGQSFIGDDAVCIGSIADEKNDKLYYFVSNNKEMITNTELEEDTGWVMSSSISADYTGEGVLITSSGTGGAQYPSFRSGYFDLIDGKTYELNVEFSDLDNAGTNPTKFFVLGAGTGGNTSYRPYYDKDYYNVPLIEPPTTIFTDYKKYTNIFTFNKSLNNDSSTMQFRVEVVNGGTHVKQVRLRSVSLVEKTDAIVEYDSKSNWIRPVLVDTTGKVLKFHPKKTKITGINIIDNLLFWTDNQTEPKKINIQDGIEGTDPSGNIHTKVINERLDINRLANIDIKEKHLTVIKKGPSSPLGLTFDEETGSSSGLYSGIITTANAGTNISSFIENVSQNTTVDNFSEILKDDVVRFEIPVNLNNSSDFSLDWKVGDTLVFEAINPDVPNVPLETFSAKAVIQDWSGNTFSDPTTSLLKNGFFNISSSHWGMNSVTYPPSTYLGFPITYGWWWYATEQSMRFQTGANLMSYAKLWQSPANHNFQAGRSYELTYTLADVAPIYVGTTAYWGDSFEGKIMARIVVDGENYDFDWQDTVGTHTQTITLDMTSRTTTSGSRGNTSTFFNNKIYFMTAGPGTQCIGTLDNVELNWVPHPTTGLEGPPNAQVEVKFEQVSVDAPLPVIGPTSTLDYVVDLYREPGHLFNDTFARFSYRYKYKDGEYSPFAPFTQAAFNPGSFDYHPKKGHNLAMINQLRELELSSFISDEMSEDIISVDLLVKMENSPSIYIVDTIKPDDPVALSETNNAWYLNKYTITSDTVKGVLPSNQLLRPWDNVPRKALAQEIVGNRLVYGNYTQGHDLLDDHGGNYSPNLSVNVESVDGNIYGKKSIKSLRDYQLGVVFADEYGRETPVMSNSTGSIHLSKEFADKSNILSVNFLNEDHPENMKYFKFFIKETSSEYYNLAMDRYYTDDDGDVWVSFTSADRNKVDLETELILKKGLNSNLVSGVARYRVLAIENEAPEFIKTSKLLIEEKTHDADNTNTDIFGSETFSGSPLEGYDTFKMNHKPFSSSSGDKLHEEDGGDLYIEFGLLANDKVSKKYKINKISCDVGADGIAAADAEYTVKLKEPLGDDVNFITDDINGLNPTKIIDNATVSIYKYVVDNSATFEGRFFVKISPNEIFKTSTTDLITNKKYRIIQSKKLYFMNDDFVTENSANKGHHIGVTGFDNFAGNANANWANLAGAYDSNRTQSHWESYGGDPSILTQHPTAGFGYNWNKFSHFATYFRNYKYAANSQQGDYAETGGILSLDIGQFRFGSGSAWKEEFLKYTSIGATPVTGSTPLSWVGGWTNALSAGGGSAGAFANPTIYHTADVRSIDDEVWFIDKGPFVGARGSNNKLHWQYIPKGQNKTGLGIVDVPGEDASKIHLAMGPLHVGDPYQLSGTNPFAWGFGSDGNPHYADDQTLQLVDKFKPGVQFRFKEDPAGTVYTCVPSTSFVRKVRYSSNYDAYGTGGSDLLNLHEAPTLSPNFTNNWILKVEPKIEWEPTNNGVLGPIDGGLEITIASTTQAIAFANRTSNTDEYYIILDTNIGTDPIYGAVPITPGLILTEYNDTGSGGSLLGLSTNPYLLVRKVEKGAGGKWRVYLTGYDRILDGIASELPSITSSASTTNNMVFRQPAMNGYSPNSTNRLNTHKAGYSIEAPAIQAVGYNIEFVEEVITEVEMPQDPAVFETEPKERTELDVYYEASGLIPTKLNFDTISEVMPVGSIITSDTTATGIMSPSGPDAYIPLNTSIISHVDGNTFIVDKPVPVSTFSGTIPYTWTPGIGPGKVLKITRPNGASTFVKVTGTNPNASNVTHEISVSSKLINQKVIIDWHNCYSFGNGVESNRIKDVFNSMKLTNGVRVSTTLDTEYFGETRGSGLIYSGIYNSNTGVNNLNQFIQAEKITKDINPIYGSIQKLHTRDGDLVTLCEDKCLRILANKDALYNADGNTNLTATQNVLGQAVPFGGEFGISKNPESFASESYRVYFTDKQRGAVMRLSKDGLTPISMHGMKDWFRDNLKLSRKLVGSYDDKKNEYNISLIDRKTLGDEIIVNGKFDTDYIEWFGSKNHWEWDSVNKNLFSDGDDNARIGQNLSSSVSLLPGKTYQVSYNVGKPKDGSDLDGRLWVTLHDKDANWAALRSTKSGLTSVGMHTENITVDNSWIPWAWGTLENHPNSINFHNKKVGYSGYFNGTIDNISVKEIMLDPITVSFSENTKGWVSFKSFVPESGISVANEYYTFVNGKSFKHHIENTHRNTFYGITNKSSITVVLNESPESIKSFHTLSYNGSQSKVNQNLLDDNYYNLVNKDGWYVSNIITDKEEGKIIEFIEKEGKWFNYIKGKNLDILNLYTDFSNSSFQGIGTISSITGTGLVGGGGDYQMTLKFSNPINSSLQVGDTLLIKQISSAGLVQTINPNEMKTYEVVAVNFSSKTVTVQIKYYTTAAEIEGVHCMCGGNHYNPTGRILAAPYVNGVPTAPMIGDYVSGDNIPLDTRVTHVDGVGTNQLQITLSNIPIILNWKASNPPPGGYLYPLFNQITFLQDQGGDVMVGDYCMFVKSNIVNTSSLRGYYADVKLENNSTDKIELFSVGSEITLSSK